MAREVTQALVLAAGRGSRLKNETPKPLLPLLGVPLLARTLFTLKKAGISDAYVVIGHEGDRVRREISAIERLDLRIHWIENPRWAEPNGVSVLAAAEHLDGPFLLTMSDHVLPVEGLRRLRAEAERGRDLVLLVDKGIEQVHDLSDATKVQLDGERITAIGKELPRFDAIDTGAFLAGPALLEALKALDGGERGPSLSDGVRRLAGQGRAWTLDGTGLVWQDVDTPEDVAVAERKLMAAWPKPTDGVVSRWINRPISLRVTRLLAPTGVTPNQVSVVTLVLGLLASWFAALGGYAWWLAAAVTFQAASVLDGTDGELASLTFRQTPFGAWMDTICDNVSYVAFIAGVMVGAHRAGISHTYLWLGALGFASAVLSLANIQMVLHRDGTSGSALSVRYAHQEGDGWLHRVFQAVHAFGKRDLISFVVLVFAVVGQLPLGLPVFGVGATLFLFPATLQANVSHWLRMRRFAALALVAFALAPAGAAAQADTATARDTTSLDSVPAVTSGTFKALTYNVAGLPPGVSQSKPLQNIPRISALLNGYDLVLVQEDFVFHALLAYAVDLPHHSDPMGISKLFSRDFLDLLREFPQLNVDRILALAGGERVMGDGLNFFSRFPFEGFERQRWSICSGVTAASNDCLATKGFTYARLTLARGVTVDVYNVHADAGRRPWDEEARRAQFRQLAGFMALRSAGQAVLVAGDTNLQAPVKADEETLQEFMKAMGLSIAGRTLHAGDEVDRFFYRGSPTLKLEPVAQSVAGEFVDPDGGPLSDHKAVRVDFKWEVVPAGGAGPGA